MAVDFQTAAVTLGHLLPEVALSEPLSAITISGLTLDSRQVRRGYLFVAITGLQLRGITFIPEAEARGAIAVLIDGREVDRKLSTRIPVIPVDNLSHQLSSIAGRFYGEPSRGIPVTGITGTNGKTTCSQLLAQAFACLNRPCGVVGTLGYGLIEKQNHRIAAQFSDNGTGMTTPDAISTQAICAELKHRGASCIAMEVSSHALVQQRVAAVDINTAVFTNLTHDHLDYHGSMAAYGAAKAGLFAMPSVSTAVVNLDDDFAGEIIATISSHSADRGDYRLVTFGLDQEPSPDCRKTAYFTLQNVQSGSDGVTADLMTPEGRHEIATQLLGRFNLSNLLAVIASLYVHEFAIEDIVAVIPCLEPIPGRMELISSGLDFQVVVDFAHTPDALKKTLEALVPHTRSELWCVFGCGGDRDQQKRPLMARVAETMADRIIVTSDNPRGEPAAQIFADIESGFQKPAEVNGVKTRTVIADRADAIESALNSARTGDVVLIAGKGHENYQLVDEQRFPFSDQQQARLCLRQREAGCEDKREREGNNMESRHA